MGEATLHVLRTTTCSPSYLLRQTCSLQLLKSSPALSIITACHTRVHPAPKSTVPAPGGLQWDAEPGKVAGTGNGT